MYMSLYKDTVQTHDNFFANPDKVVELSNLVEYTNGTEYPGRRSVNLLQSNNFRLVEFSKYFAKRLADEVFYGLTQFQLDIRFHKNDVYDDPAANAGWIHADGIAFAGVVYLNKSELSIDTGTSIFLKTSADEFITSDFTSRQQLNLTKQVSKEYLEDLKQNHSNFTETIKVGNVFNRLVAYDSNMWHCPTNYCLKSGEDRTSLVFFIDQAAFVPLPSQVGITSTWSDK
jgi:hypothetical protein